MSIETQLLAVIGTDKALYQRIKPHIKSHTFSDEMNVLLKEVDTWYEDSADPVSWDTLLTSMLVHRKTSADEADLYRSIVEAVADEELSSIESATKDILNHYIKMDYATRIIDTAMRVADGSTAHSLDDVLKSINEYHSEVKAAVDKTEVFASTDISVTLETVASDGLEWRLEPLNISLGPLRQGDFIIIAARPETGKTTMMASELSHFGGQIKDDRPIIWVNNEESSDKVFLRVVQAALGCTMHSIMSDTAKAMADYARLVGNKDRILVLNKDSKRNNVNYLTGLFNELNPAVIVFDQLDKVHGFNRESRDDLRLGKLYEWAREQTERSAVLAVSQVNGSGEGQRWIFQDQLRGSTTDKAGEADAIVTIGKVNGDHSLINSRFIHVPKNKLYGGPRSDEAHRHGFFEAEITPEIARYAWSGKSGKE